MDSTNNPLLCCRIMALTEGTDPNDPAVDAAWRAAARDYAGVEQKDAELEAALAGRDVEAVKRVVAAWDGDHRPRPLQDRELLKKAMKAFRKRLKLTRLDDESRLGVGATTRGESSAVFAITPPREYPEEVWRELARQGRLKAERRSGLYALNE